MEKKIVWLLQSDQWTQYRTRLDLLCQQADSKQVIDAKQEMIEHPMIKQIIVDLSSWQEEVITNHKKAGMWLHKLSFLAEIGLKAEDDMKLNLVCEHILSRLSPDGVINVKVNVPKVFGGGGIDIWGWALCDTPLVMYCMAKMGYSERMKKGTEHLLSLVQDNGWPCASSPEMGKFRGPGRKSDPCPYATLLMLKLLGVYKEYKNSKEAKTAVESLLSLWKNSREQKPYLFKAGTDFRKLKAPFVWYDILHVADVLSQYEYAQKDKRFIEMWHVILEKADEQGLYTPESVWLAWKGFDFAQKKNPSAWITLLAERVQGRIKA